MKVIFLNCWQGKVGKPLFDFIKIQKDTTDIFCFVEVSPELHSKYLKLLTNYQDVYDFNKLVGLDGLIYGQAIFVKKGIVINNSRTKVPIYKTKISIYKNSPNDIGFMQCVDLLVGERVLSIANIHGMSNNWKKLDTPERLKQSNRIIKFYKNKKNPRIIGGDFNLMPQTESIRLFEDNGYKNLIREFNIKSTRNKIAWNQFRKSSTFVKQYFADYCFVSTDVKVKNFTVPNIQISDHLPLILEFEV